MENNNNFAVLALVGVVAIVGIISLIMVAGTNNQITTPTTNDANIAGEARFMSNSMSTSASGTLGAKCTGNTLYDSCDPCAGCTCTQLQDHFGKGVGYICE